MAGLALAVSGLLGVGLPDAPVERVAALHSAVNSVPLGVRRAGQALSLHLVEPCRAHALALHRDLVGPAVGRGVHEGSARALAAVERSACGTDLADSVDLVGARHAAAGGSVPDRVGPAGRTSGLADVGGGVEDVAGGAAVGVGALGAVPVGAGGTGGAGADLDLVEAGTAGAGDAVEEGVGGAGGDDDFAGEHALLVLQDVARVADALQAVVVGVGGAGGDHHALSAQELAAVSAHAGLEGGVVALVFVAGGDEVGLDALAVDVADVAHQALADHTVEGFVVAAGLAAAQDPEVSSIAVALSVPDVSVDSAVLVVAALSVDDRVAVVADAAS